MHLVDILQIVFVFLLVVTLSLSFSLLSSLRSSSPSCLPWYRYHFNYFFSTGIFLPFQAWSRQRTHLAAWLPSLDLPIWLTNLSSPLNIIFHQRLLSLAPVPPENHWQDNIAPWLSLPWLSLVGFHPMVTKKCLSLKRLTRGSGT